MTQQLQDGHVLLESADEVLSYFTYHILMVADMQTAAAMAAAIAHGLSCATYRKVPT